MLSLNDIIDFLMGLLRDPAAAAAFEQDPEGTLAAAGLDGASGQDIRDAQLLMTDSGAAVPDGPAPAHHGGHDPVREIQHVTQHFHAAPEPPAQIVTTIDDRDTFVINDSFTSDDDVTVVQDSFNEVQNDVTAIQDNSVDNSVTNVENDTIAIQDNDVVTQIAEPEDAFPVDPEPEPLPEPEPEPEPEPDPADLDAGAELAAG